MILVLLSLIWAKDAPFESVVFTNDDLDCKFWRIPAVIRAKDNSIITSTDARWKSNKDLPNEITVYIRRSTDNGKTWQEPVQIPNQTSKDGYGDASLVMDKKSGRIFCLFNGEQGFTQSTPEKPMKLFVSHSDDNGVTWTPKREFTSSIYGSECTTCEEERKTWQGIFMTSGAALQLRDGRLMVVADVRKKNNSAHNHIIYSDDNGETWNITLQPSFNQGNEAKIVELNNGTILMSVRNNGHRIFVYSTDGGETFGNPVHKKEIVEPGNNGDIIRYTSTKDGYDKDRIIHTITYNPSQRINMSILISYDEGETWPVKKNFSPTGAAYSSAAILKDGNIGVYYEKNNEKLFDMVFSVVDLEWITDGKDKYTPPKKI